MDTLIVSLDQSTCSMVWTLSNTPEDMKFASQCNMDCAKRGGGRPAVWSDHTLG